MYKLYMFTMKLGKVQQNALIAVKALGSWVEDETEWRWGDRSKTIKLLDSLVKRGLLNVTQNQDGKMVYRPVADAP